MDIILTSNSPGEVSGWVKPVAHQLSQMMPSARVHLFLLPCSFASGSEYDVARGIPGVDQVYPISDYWRLALYNRLPARFHSGKKGLVLFLGGDQTHAVIIGRRLKFPVFIYTEGLALWPKRVRRYFVPYPEALRRVEERAPGQAELVGNLMLDAVRPSQDKDIFRAEHGITPSDQLVAVFPGSRPESFRHFITLFYEAAKIVRERRPQAKFIVSLSQFIPEDLTQEAHRTWEGLAQVNTGIQYDIMNAADVALTIPGTNTAEMAFLGLPMIVAVPLNWPETIPLEGIPGLIGGFPLVGKALKTAIIKKAAGRIRFTAFPNIVADRRIVPEVVGYLSPNHIAEQVDSLLGDKELRESMGKELQEIIGPPGAAKRLVSALIDATVRAGEI